MGLVTAPYPDGVTLTPLRVIEDARGAVLHFLRADATDFAGFGECYFSEVVPGAVKAWKRHREQTQNLAVPIGRIALVIHDPKQTAGGRFVRFELGRPDAYARVRVPPGLWYGFSCLGDTPALIVNCPDRPHDPAESETRPIDEGPISYDWSQRPV